MSGYFDPAYFDPAYFDAGDEVVASGPRYGVHAYPLRWPQLVPDDPGLEAEAVALLLT